MSRIIKTYSLSERAASTDFSIHDERATARITRVYGRTHALKVGQASIDDYAEAFRA